MVKLSLKVSERLYTIAGIKNQKEMRKKNQIKAPNKNGCGCIFPEKYNTPEIMSNRIITMNNNFISRCAIKW